MFFYMMELNYVFVTYVMDMCHVSQITFLSYTILNSCLAEILFIVSSRCVPILIYFGIVKPMVPKTNWLGLR